MVIYVITNEINGKQYVGQTIRSYKQRFKEHLRCSVDNILSKAIKKYGKDNFTIKVIDMAKTHNELDDKEIYWIDKLNTFKPNGYNMTIGGQGTTGVFITEESREKFRVNRMGSKNPNSTKIINITENKVFNSIIEASEYYGVNKTGISHCCRGKQKTAYDYNWAFYEDYLNGNFEVYDSRVINLDTGEVFNSTKEASESCNAHASTISAVCNGYKHSKTADGYRWAKYKKAETLT